MGRSRATLLVAHRLGRLEADDRCSATAAAHPVVPTKGANVDHPGGCVAAGAPLAYALAILAVFAEVRVWVW